MGIQTRSLVVSVILFVFIIFVETRSVFHNILQQRASKRDDSDCEVYKHEAMHAVLDKLCGDCNELFRHEISELHAKCRDSCFENKVFQMCFEAINPHSATLRRRK